MDSEHKPFQRRSPDEYLKEINQMKKGKLKLYTGAAPGVGKTFKMLQDAHDLKKDGVDVVIGLIETHNRKETEEQIKDLEQIPLKRIKYKGKNFFEVDAEAIIKRAPDVVLIDELAHTNIKGSKNKKRYMDVEDILNAGINVYSAMNIQHLESMHDIVQQITKVFVRERVPDFILHEAEEIQLVDITPEMLQKRLKEGKIYHPEKVERSLNNFFTVTNLGALRELALREVADDVDEKIVSSEANGNALRIKERILVCVQYADSGEKLIRRGARMASRLDADLYVLNVKTRNSLADQSQHTQNWETLSKQFEGTFLIEQAMDKKPADIIIEVAKSKHITQILLGQSARTRWEEITKGSIVNAIMRQTNGIDIHIVADSNS